MIHGSASQEAKRHTSFDDECHLLGVELGRDLVLGFPEKLLKEAKAFDWLLLQEELGDLGDIHEDMINPMTLLIALFGMTPNQQAALSREYSIGFEPDVRVFNFPRIFVASCLQLFRAHVLGIYLFMREDELPQVIPVEGWPLKVLAEIGISLCSTSGWETAFGTLAPWEERVLTDRFARGHSIEKIAKREGDVKRVKDVLRAASRKIKNSLQKDAN